MNSEFRVQSIQPDFPHALFPAGYQRVFSDQHEAMKPLLSKSEDDDSLQALGRASVQIVHDLKNQLNGLKLYATFLRKRVEKADRPPDEIETIDKLIAGLDRAADDLSTLVTYARPVDLRKQNGVDLKRIMREVAESIAQAPRVTGHLTKSLVVEADPLPLTGEFDAISLSEALKLISVGTMKLQLNGEPIVRVSLHREASPDGAAVIEWHGLTLDHDPFRSFVGGHEVRMSLAAKVIEAHGGSAEQQSNSLRVRLPLHNVEKVTT